MKVLSVLQGLQVLQKTLRVPEGFLTDRAGGEGRSGGQLRKEWWKIWTLTWKKNQMCCTECCSHDDRHRAAVTLCSLVRRWSMMLLLKWVWHVPHQRFVSFFSLRRKQTTLCQRHLLLKHVSLSQMIWHELTLNYHISTSGTKSFSIHNICRSLASSFLSRWNFHQWFSIEEDMDIMLFCR